MHFEDFLNYAPYELNKDDRQRILPQLHHCAMAELFFRLRICLHGVILDAKQATDHVYHLAILYS